MAEPTTFLAGLGLVLRAVWERLARLFGQVGQGVRTARGGGQRRPRRATWDEAVDELADDLYARCRRPKEPHTPDLFRPAAESWLRYGDPGAAEGLLPPRAKPLPGRGSLPMPWNKPGGWTR